MSSSSDEELVVRNPYTLIASSGGRRNRRSCVSREQESKNRALEEMKRARDTGSVHRVDVANLIKPVYEEVDEEEYMKIVQERQRDNFVVDDDGSGYVDHGIDFFDEEQHSATNKVKKPKKKRDKAKRKAIDDFFNVSNTKKVKEENAVTVANDPDVEALLNECDLSSILKENAVKKMDGSKTNSVPLSRFVSIGFCRKQCLKDSETASNLMEVKEINESREPLNVTAPQCVSLITDVENSTNFQSSSQENIEEKSAHESRRADSFVNVQSVISKDAKKCVVEEMVQSNVSFIWADSEAMKNEQRAKGNVATGSFMHTSAEGESVLRFYWLDAFEDPVKMPGTVYLFGRLINGGISESCCVAVKNIWRQVFFLPREKRLVNEVQTDEVDLMQVNAEVQQILKSMGVKVVKCKPCEKKFAYNDGVVPQSAQVLEVHYSFNDPRLPTDMSGETFSHVFNTTANAMERLLVETGMKGPSWVDISGCCVSSLQVSYVKHEFLVDMERMKSIFIIDCSDPPPEINLLTMNVITTVNHKKESEIVLISCIFDRKCTIGNPTLDRNFLERFCILSKPTLSAYPFDLKINLKQIGMDTVVHETANERHLLNQFLCKLQNLDPDAYAGHDLAAQFAILSSRLEKLGITHWSRLGRLKRSITVRQAAHMKQWELTAGRLVLDSRLSAMELVRMRSYDLSDLSSDLLGINDHFTVNQDVSAYFANSAQLIRFINNTWMDAWLSLAIIVELNALPLFIQITKIVGGVLSRTMLGGRAERNEYLLLHAFNKAGYVAPDKYQSDFKKKKQSGLEDTRTIEDDSEDHNKILHNRKGQYAGGLVLDPKIGLYDTFVLLLDFNSLYPSIIQEYNICFTTVDMSKKDKDAIPELPSDTNEGILPREIRSLVERRRDVKRMMKSEKLTQQQRQQYDIRQMGLKLTANSMYGCLGFQQSRFYAKPLAALITAQGREILMHTKDLIEKNGYSVIYGDTDSVMINTGFSERSELQRAKKLGNDATPRCLNNNEKGTIKKIINQSYKKLEIDIDGIFMKLLLLKKKKYAGLAVDLNDERKTKREIKGLDIVRRDYSFIVKQIGNEILDIILSVQSQNRDEIIEQIHSHLRKLKDDMAEELLQISMFQIFKQLTRKPDEYANISVQPHAAVAQRLNATGKFKFHRGDIVGYIICEDGSGKSATQRAYHITEVQENTNLKVDFNYYLAQQILPVVSRLCVPIEECNEAWIAQALGLDSSAYRKHATYEENVNKEEQLMCFSHYNFERCKPFKFACPNDGCEHMFLVRECVVEDNNGGQKLWLSECSVCHNSLLHFGAYLYNQLQLTLDKVISDYCKISYVCDDIGCAYRTRTLVLGWTKEGAQCPKCKSGFMRREVRIQYALNFYISTFPCQYSSKGLYEQLIFYQKLFDVTKAIDSFTEEQRMKLRCGNGWKEATALLAGLLSLCDQYIADNQYNCVSLSYLFSIMRSL
uniref:DNA polymerase n=1 Tax=Elaeophora elaphi TaxID=1147741 RepID=A0A0R3RPY0_9BILA